MKKVLIQDKKPAPRSILIATLCLVSALVTGCSGSEKPFDHDRDADDEVPASAETFSADPETTRKLSNYEGFDFYIAKPLSSADMAGDLCVLIVDNGMTATESCGGTIIDIGVQGVRAQYYVDGEAEETGDWEKLTPNLRVKSH